MGNVQPLSRTRKVRGRSDEANEESFESAAANPGFRVSVPDLDGYANFEDLSLSEEKEKLEKTPLLIASSPPRLERPVDLESTSKVDEPRTEHVPQEEKLDLDEDEKKLTSSASELRQIGSGPFRRFKYSSLIPYDDDLKRREFKQWVRARVQTSGKNGFRISFEKRASDRIGVVFTPLNAWASDADSNMKALCSAVAQAESCMNRPAIAQSKPFDSRLTILAKKLVLDGVEYVFLINVPQGSKLVVAMKEITYKILSQIYHNCQMYIARDAVAYGFEFLANRPGFAELDSRKINNVILRAIMCEVTELQDQEYDVHRLADDGPMLEKLTGNVIESVSSA